MNELLDLGHNCGLKIFNGAGIVASIARDILLARFKKSGRFYHDIEETLQNSYKSAQLKPFRRNFGSA